jgi:hypothetical protein
MGEERNADRILIGESSGNRPLWKIKKEEEEEEDNMKTYMVKPPFKVFWGQ